MKSMKNSELRQSNVMPATRMILARYGLDLFPRCTEANSILLTNATPPVHRTVRERLEHPIDLLESTFTLGIHIATEDRSQKAIRYHLDHLINPPNQANKPNPDTARGSCVRMSRMVYVPRSLEPAMPSIQRKQSPQRTLHSLWSRRCVFRLIPDPPSRTPSWPCSHACEALP